MKIKIYIIPEPYKFEDYRKRSSCLYISRGRSGGGFHYTCPSENLKNLMTRLWKHGRDWVCLSYKNREKSATSQMWQDFIMSKLTSNEIDTKEFIRILRG